MKLILSKITIEKFLGYKPITVRFFDDINFLIGKNDTGKTTFIRIINACLSIDLNELAQFQFEKITLQLKDTLSSNVAELVFERAEGDSRVRHVKFRAHKKADYEVFARTPARRVPLPTSRPVPQRPPERPELPPITDLARRLKDEIEFSWLPLLRYRSPTHFMSFDDDDQEEASFDRRDPLNNKIEDLVQKITLYLATLESRSAAETRQFQKVYLLSLLDFRPNVNFDPRPDYVNQYDHQKLIMQNIFLELGFEESEYKQVLENHFGRATIAAENFAETDKGLDINDLFVLTDTERLNDIVRKFQNYERRKGEIFAPKDQFVDVMNSFLTNKRFFFSESNQPVFHARVRTH